VPFIRSAYSGDSLRFAWDFEPGADRKTLPINELKLGAFFLAIAGPFGHIPPAFASNRYNRRAKSTPIPTALDDIPALAADGEAQPDKEIRCRSHPIASRH
jgi:hypothetical protein